MKTRKKKTKKQVFMKWLDLLWGLIIHNRDIYCQFCGKSNSKLDAHHIFHRGLSVRWDTKTGILLCYYCHNWRLTKDAEGMRKCFINKLGEELYNKLYEQSKQTISNPDYESIEQKLILELSQFNIEIPKKPKLIK